jgi:hypothetical protein
VTVKFRHRTPVGADGLRVSDERFVQTAHPFLRRSKNKFRPKVLAGTARYRQAPSEARSTVDVMPRGGKLIPFTEYNSEKCNDGRSQPFQCQSPPCDPGLARGDPDGRIGAMSRRPARFTQADIHRALKAVVQSGADMAIEITAEGSIRIARNSDVSRLDPAPIKAGPAPVLW